MKLAPMFVLLAGCYDATDFSVGSVEGSLVPFFDDSLVCTCGVELAAGDREVQFQCSPEEDPIDSLRTSRARGAPCVPTWLDEPWPANTRRWYCSG